MNKDIEIGSKVKLSEDTNWTLTENNPLGCIGVVTGQNGWTEVKWSNGGWNAYIGDAEDLIVQEPE